MNSWFDDHELKQKIKTLMYHQPRPGYKQRFWARIESRKQVMAARLFRWALFSTATMGLIAGVGINFMIITHQAQKSGAVKEIHQISGLPVGSLSQVLVFNTKRGGN